MEQTQEVKLFAARLYVKGCEPLDVAFVCATEGSLDVAFFCAQFYGGMAQDLAPLVVILDPLTRFKRIAGCFVDAPCRLHELVAFPIKFFCYMQALNAQRRQGNRRITNCSLRKSVTGSD